MEQAIERKDLIDQQIEVLVPEWSLGPIVEAMQTSERVNDFETAGIGI